MGGNSHRLEFTRLNELPAVVQEILSQEFAHVKLSQFEKSFASLSDAYRSGVRRTKHLISDEIERLLYLATRLPATYATLCEVLQVYLQMQDQAHQTSILDIGAGPGTFLMAAWHKGLLVKSATFVEKDPGWRIWGEKWLRQLYPNISCNWLFQDIEKDPITFTPHDIVALSYSLGEFSPENRNSTIEKCWSLTKSYLFLVEPGTPAGFSRIRDARAFLLEKGACVVAPCTHSAACPVGENDWCHFSSRLARTSLHRKIKAGNLGYEDEKYAYLIVARQPHQLASARIVHSPQKNKGHVRLQVCREGKIETTIFSKKQGDLYRKATRLKWGDEI
jgi:ribosomal protein RSM22 (predicted rRNA methylase)